MKHLFKHIYIIGVLINGLLPKERLSRRGMSYTAHFIKSYWLIIGKDVSHEGLIQYD